MDLVTLKKKLSTYVTSKGQLRNLNEEIMYEVLIAWESWTGPSADFYRALGFTYKQMAGVVGKAKKLKREGYFGTSEFKQVKVDGPQPADTKGVFTGAELVLSNGNIVRFSHVEILIDFLRRQDDRSKP
jgi:hypothetical protein